MALDAPLSPQFIAVRDVGSGDSSYLAAGLAPAFALPSLGAQLAIGASYAVAEGGDGFAFNDVTATAALAFIWGPITGGPHLGVTHAAASVNAERTSVWTGFFAGL